MYSSHYMRCFCRELMDTRVLGYVRVFCTLAVSGECRRGGPPQVSNIADRSQSFLRLVKQSVIVGIVDSFVQLELFDGFCL